MEQHCHGTQGGWVKHPDSPLLGGQYGTCFDISLLKEEDHLKMYFSWRDKHCVAVCQSTDGLHWSEPTLCILPKHEDAISRPSIVRRGGIYHMWYTSQQRPGQAEGTSTICHAVSEDGVHFTRTGDEPVLTPELPWEKRAVMCPSVLWDEARGLYRMWYSGGDQYEPDAIGYAESADGLCWRKSPVNPIFAADPKNTWEQHKTTACQVFYHEGWFLMFYIGFETEHYAQIGMARSRDGITSWERAACNPIIAPDEGAWDGDACYKPFVLPMQDTWMLWYNGRLGHKEQIGLVTHQGLALSF